MTTPRGLTGPTLAQANPQGADGPLIGQPLAATARFVMPTDRAVGPVAEARTDHDPARVRVVASAAGGADVWITGDIGRFWDEGNDVETMRAQIGATTGPLTVHLNSGGGSAFDGIAMYNVLKAHPGGVHVHVEGLAASAASVIAMAGVTRTMHPGSQLMIHNAMSGAFGNAADLRAAADTLEQVSDGLADIYAEATGVPAATWRTAMDAETWSSPEAAVEAGLATGVARPRAADAPATDDDDTASATMPLVAWAPWGQTPQGPAPATATTTAGWLAALTTTQEA